MKEGCNNAPHSRGLCTGCYGALRHLVLSEKTTWGQLEIEGKIKAKGKSGPRAAKQTSAGSVHED